MDKIKVSTLQGQSNYQDWKFQVENLLKYYKLTKVVSGEVKEEAPLGANASADERKQYEERHDLWVKNAGLWSRDRGLGLETGLRPLHEVLVSVLVSYLWSRSLSWSRTFGLGLGLGLCLVMVSSLLALVLSKIKICPFFVTLILLNSCLFLALVAWSIILNN